MFTALKGQTTPLPSESKRSALALGHINVLVMLGIVLAAWPHAVAAQSDVIGSADADVDCPNFLSLAEGGQAHAQAVFEAAGGLQGPDLYDLDGEQEQQNRLACDGEGTKLGGPTPATCENFKEQSHAQALLEAAGADDPYNLDPDGDTVACKGGSDAPAGSGNGGRPNPEPLDGVPPETRGTTVIISTGAIDTSESLEARLAAQFAALEARFAAFEERAENGFGRFPESGDDTTGGGQGTIVRVSTAQQPVSKAQRTTSNDDRSILRSQKAKDDDGERGKERKGKRARNKGKQQNGR